MNAGNLVKKYINDKMFNYINLSADAPPDLDDTIPYEQSKDSSIPGITLI